ncbi:caspase family protein [Paraglaciecola sp.]|uniref:caspase family protein n=1 Tax=Paraglaciecola sp. TaxID=1920173 RepID=UPI003EF4A04F
MPKRIILSFICLVLSQNITFAQDMQRYALIIGNQNYKTAPLKNTINDATAIADNLTELGYKVSLLQDTKLDTLHAEIQQFYLDVQRAADKPTLALVYYAGHALQINHQNYLVPLDMQFENQQEFVSGLYKINNLFSQIQQSKNLQNIIILDACRTNPFAKINSTASINVDDGLSPIKAPTNTLIAFATEPDGVAADGKGKNGVYTKHLLRHIGTQISVEEVFKKVRQGVSKQTRNKQIPWEHSSLLSEVFFSPPKNRDIPDFTVF